MQALATNGPGPMNNVMSMGGVAGPHTVDILIPGNKVGLIIGKGGETIKSMQERSQCKIVFTQDISVPSDQEKSLRITGDSVKVESAKKMVSELVYTDRSMGGQTNQYGQRNIIETISVPRSLVGMVIGKGGDMIRKIQDEHGVRLQFDQDNKVSPERLCTVTGSPERVKEAIQRVNQLMENDRDRGHEDFNEDRDRGHADYNAYGGMGGGMGGGGGGGMGGGGGGMGRGGGRVNGPGGDGRETTFAVPVEKCGLVIGKNGVTISEIKLQSGAHVEIQRGQADNVPQKMFTIIGDSQQTQKAIELISAKIGQSPPEALGGHSYGGGGGGAQYASPTPSPHQAQAGSYGQGWGDATSYPYTSQPYSQQTAPVAADSAAAATTADWSSYYASTAAAHNYWGQTAAQQPQPTTAAATQQAVGQEAGACQPPNFAQAWYEYYLSLGLYDHANMMLQSQAQDSANR